MRHLIISAFTILGFAHAVPGLASECRTVENIRIDSADQLYLLDNVCVVTQNLAIFPTDVESLVLPDLKEARLINIDSDALKAVAMPNLQKVSWLYLESTSLEAIELSKLQNVWQTFGVDASPGLVYLSVPALEHIGMLYLRNNANLKFIFAEKLTSIETFLPTNNPALEEASFEYLKAASASMTPPVRQQRQDIAMGLIEYRQALINSYINPDLPPTGHPTYFGTIGFAQPVIRRYYDDYPLHYDGLWQFYLARYHFYNWIGGGYY